MKLKKILLSVLALNLLMLLPGTTYAMVEWIRSYGFLNTEDFANKLQVDDNGYSYLTGSSNGDFVTVKVDPNSNIVWAISFGTANTIDFASGLAVDCNSNVYVSGVFDFNGNNQLALLKYDPNGTLLWHVFFDPGFINSGRVIMSMHSGRIYIAASVDNGIVIVCFDDAGTMLWDFLADSDPNTQDFPIAISAGAQDVWVAGRIGSSSGSTDFGLIRIDRFGQLRFLSIYNKGLDDTPTAIKVMPNGEVFMSGFFLHKSGENRIVTIKFRDTGRKAWDQTFELSPTSNNGRGWNIATDDVGNPIVVGGISNGFDKDFITIKYDGSTGQWTWYTMHSFNVNADEEAGLVVVDRCGNVKVGGQSNGDFFMVIYGPGPSLLGTDSFGTVGNDSPLFVELDRLGNLLVGGVVQLNGQPHDFLLAKLSAQFCSIGAKKCP